MSLERTIDIVCPSCKETHKFFVWDSLNTSIDPSIKEYVKDGSLFTFKCPECGTKTTVLYDFLYHQMEDRIMIFCCTSEESVEGTYKTLTEDGPANQTRKMFDNDYLIRIVRGQNELREKIQIFDEGLDDRVIELIKLMFQPILQKEKPDGKEYYMLYLKNDGKDCLQAFVDGQFVGGFNIEPGLYDKICEKYLSELPDVRKDKPIIDMNRAMEIVENR